MSGRNGIFDILIFQYFAISQEQHHQEGITRDGYKKHCYSSHDVKICLLRLEVTEEARGGDDKFRCEKCRLLLSREQTYRCHVKRCKGWPQNIWFV